MCEESSNGWNNVSNPRNSQISSIFSVKGKQRTKKKSRKNKNSLVFANQAVLFGEPPEIRTPDTLIKSQVLCRLS